MRLLRRLGLCALVVACVTTVVAYQATRPAKGLSDPRVFIPSPGVFTHLPPSMRATVADVYWLFAIQYYGEHVKSDQRLDSLPAMVDLITTLSPRFREAYYFGAFASVDWGRPGEGYALLEKGYKANPDDWRFPFYLGFFAYTFADNAQKDAVASQWYAKAAGLPGSPSYLRRFAAELAQRGNERQKAIDLWTQVYATGDKYARQKAVAALDGLLPRDKIAREKAVAGLKGQVPAGLFAQFVADVFQGYQ